MVASEAVVGVFYHYRQIRYFETWNLKEIKAY